MPFPPNAILGKFETSGPLAPPNLSAQIGALVTEVGGVDPTTIIRVDQDWKIHVYWTVKGNLTELVCGKWCVNAFLESMGPGPEINLHPADLKIDLQPAPGANDYYAMLLIQAGAVKADDCSTPFKLVVTVTYMTPKGQPGPAAGFVEGPILQFYHP